MKTKQDYARIARELEELKAKNAQLEAQNSALSTRIKTREAKERRTEIKLASHKTASSYHISVNALLSDAKIAEIVAKYATDSDESQKERVVSDDFDEKLKSFLKDALSHFE